MTTFALVHGAYGSGALWGPLVAELGARGHRTLAPDLPIGDPDAGFADYARVVAAALEGAGEDVVVVGHSMGGVTAALVAAERPVRAVVYLAALLPRPRASLADVFRDEPAMMLPALPAAEVKGPDGLRHLPPQEAQELLFHDVAQPAAWVEGLRGQAVSPYFEPLPLDALPPGRYVVCRADRVVSPDWGRDAARRLLGAEAAELDGGHSPQLARPAALADLLGA
jgi:pimeloyl-ACP methyl ester carboxylesterase